MPYNIQTGQLDLGGLKEYFLRPASTSLSGSSLNTTGFYPYTGNPSDFAHSGYVTDISGDISGYIDSVSGVIRADLVESGTNLSGYTTSVKGELRSDILGLSGTVDLVSGDVRLISGVTFQNQDDIGNLGNNLAISGQNLEELITGISGDISGHIDTTSGVLNTKISNLDVTLRSHVSSDYVTKRNVDEDISGQKTFLKNPNFNQGIYLNKVGNHSNFSTIQDGVGSYSIVEAAPNVGSQSYQTMTNYMRFPNSGDSVRQDIIVSSLMYKGSIPD